MPPTAPDSAALLADLTEAQRTAVMHVDGPLLVLAGPGSGKTRVITRRVAHLIANGIPAWQILAVTFTNKAAGEMRERIDALVPADVPGRHGLTVSTFHSLCTRILRRYAPRAGLDPSFVIYDAADQREALKAAIKESELDSKQWNAANVGSAISRAKNDLIGAEEYAARARDWRERTIAKLFAAYERTLATNRAVDFDDLLLRTATLLQRDETARGELQQRFRYLLIDEYQDTNKAQFMIARAIAEAHGNICVVGDPDQSIYGWRGADLRNILDFEEVFQNAAVVPLGENFRSTGHIVNAAAALIDHNLRRKAKKLFTALGPGEAVSVLGCMTERHEADVVLDHVRRWNEQGIPFRGMALLYRMNALSRVLEEALRDAAVPYLIVRGTAFYDRKEIRDALAYLRLLSNPADAVSLGRIVNVPPRGLGETSLDRLAAWARGRGVPVLEALRRADEIAGLIPKARAAAQAFAAMIDRWRGDLGRAEAVGGDSLARLVSRVLTESGLQSFYAKADRKGEEEGEDRVANLNELVSAAAQFAPPELADSIEPEETGSSSVIARIGSGVHGIDTLSDALSAWLESVALVADADALDPQRGAVTLMTLHAAKGLEYDAVAIVGLEHNLLPHSRSSESDAELEEERRLFFVGMTRARRHLLLTHAKWRTQRGFRERSIESAFLRELPRDGVERINLAEEETGFDSDLPDFNRLARRGQGLRRAAPADGVDPNYPDEVWTPAGEGASADGSARRSEGAKQRLGAGRTNPFGNLAVGCMVSHPAFGYGRVEGLMPRGPTSTVRVNFERVGVKTLVMEYANLTRIG